MRGIFVILSAILAQAAAAQTIETLKYTVPPDLGYLNVSSKNNYYAGGAGAYFELVREAFDGSDARLQFSASETYNDAVQGAMAGNFDFAVGVAFDEHLLGLLDFVPTPIFDDSLDVVINSGGKAIKGLDREILQLLGSRRAVALAGLYLPILAASSPEYFQTADEAVDAVLSGTEILIIPSSLMSGYLDKNAGAERIKTLKINRHSKSRALFFIAVNRESKSKQVSHGGSAKGLFEFMAERLSAMESDGRLKKIMLRK
ncbi:MAG: hypothetical protein LBT92_02730 [Rickettsiales bacterium]|jgi:hypothetical protein|nr:hypothetical protein [Rickettsiales bacterium]